MWDDFKMKGDTIPQCSFCHKSQEQVNRLTPGPGNVYICDECVDLYREHIEREYKNRQTIEKIIQLCASCGIRPPLSHNFCYNCGAKLDKNGIGVNHAI